MSAAGARTSGPARRRGASAAPRPSDGRIERLRAVLDEVRDGCDVASRMSSDPVEFLHGYRDPLDREIVALVASSFAFGNVKAFKPKIAEALRRLGPSPASACDDRAALARKLRGLTHRVYKADDVVALLAGGRRVQRAHGSLGAYLATLAREHGDDLAPALDAWVAAIRRAGGLDRRDTTGSRHILAAPGGGSAAKRLMLLLRWMVRRADGVDVGDWPLSPSLLVLPLDVHLHKLSKNLGLTRRASPNWQAALEVTDALRRIDGADPVKYDFALCHLGMVQRCPSRRDPVRCEGCGVRPVCRHWPAPQEPGPPSPTKLARRPRAG